MSSGRSLYVAACFSLVLTGYSTVYAQQLPIKSYTTVDGLAHDRVTRIMRDSRGFLWFCTVDGLSRFDGTHFTSYRREQGLPFPFVNDILEARPGEYWVATNGGGAARLNLRNVRSTGTEGRSRFTAYPVGDGPATNRVRVLHRDRAGRLWVGTEGGLFLLEEGKSRARFRRVELSLASHADERVQIWALLEDRVGNLWLGTSVGLLRRLPDGLVSHYPGEPSSGDPRIRSLLEDGEGRIWLSRHTEVIVLKPQPSTSRTDVKPLSLRFQTGRRFTPADGLAAERVRAVFQSTDGRIWVGSAVGLSEFDGKRFRSYAASQGLGAVNSLAEDSDGNLWIGTDLRGALRIARSGFVSFKRTDGLPHPWITSIFEDRAGDLHAISGGELTINRFDGQRFTSVKPNLPDRGIRSGIGRPVLVLQDRTGEWWAPTRRGLYRFARVPRIEDLKRALPKAVYRTRDGLASDDVFVAFEDSRGDLWIGTGAPALEGVTRWERATGAFYRYSDRHGLPALSTPTAFREDEAGNLWVALWDRGLARYRDGRFTIFTAAEGAPAGDVWQIYLDQSRRLWVASSEGGLSRVDDPGADRPRFVAYTTAEGLSSNDVRCLTEDRQGRLYLGTARGVDRLDPATGRVNHYNTADGLASSEVLAAFRDKAGALWFGTYQGLSRITPEPDRSGPPPPVLIGGLRIAGVSQQVSELGEEQVAWRELGPHQNQVQIDFFGLSFRSGGALRYQYKLEGADHDWSAPATQRTVNYANLAPGAYRFLVRALSPDGAIGPTPASVAFNILPPIWRRWWFIAFVAVAMASAVLAFDRYRVARMNELKAALSESQRLTRELTGQGAELREANQALELEYAVTRILAESVTSVDAMPRMLRAICENAGWDIGTIWNVDRQSHVLHCIDIWHRPGTSAAKFDELTRQCVFLPGEGLPGRVLESSEAQWVTDLARDSNLPRSAAADEEGLRSVFGFPLPLRGEVVGVLELFSREQREPDAGQIRKMATIGSDIGQLLDGKRAEEALRESETRFRTLAETASDAIITIDASGAIVFVNPAVERVFGYEAAEMIGKELTMIMPEYLRHMHHGGLKRYQDTGRQHISREAVELPGLDRDGHEIPLEISFGEFSSNGQRYFTGIARDVTERKRAEEALRRSREERLAELERVRQRIATDLHDDIGSSLTQISILSEVVGQQTDRQDSPVSHHLSMIAGTSRELVDAMSDIVWAINPQKDHLHDLTQRMRRFAADSFTALNIKLQLRLPDDEEDIRLGANLRREVFLILKEGVNNMVRHSGCTEADIEFCCSEGLLKLRMTDNGRGFDVEREFDGHGLMSMRDRTRGIGGQFSLISQPGHGTTITADIPLELEPQSFA